MLLLRTISPLGLPVRGRPCTEVWSFCAAAQNEVHVRWTCTLLRALGILLIWIFITTLSVKCYFCPCLTDERGEFGEHKRSIQLINGRASFEQVRLAPATELSVSSREEWKHSPQFWLLLAEACFLSLGKSSPSHNICYSWLGKLLGRKLIGLGSSTGIRGQKRSPWLSESTSINFLFHLHFWAVYSNAGLLTWLFESLYGQTWRQGPVILALWRIRQEDH